MTEKPSTEKLSTAYTLADIARWFDLHTLRKARDYQHRVSHMRLTADMLAATVQGNAKLPYEVFVQFEQQGETIQARGLCTCPVHTNCKHVVAALVAAHAQRGQAERVNPKVLEWAEGLRRHGQQSQKAGTGQAATPAKSASSQQLHYVLFHDRSTRAVCLQIRKGVVRADGSGRSDPWNNLERAMLQPPQFVDDADLALFRFLLPLARQSPTTYWDHLPLTGMDAGKALPLMLQTGRAWFDPLPHERLPHPLFALGLGEARLAELGWLTEAEGETRPVLRATPAIHHAVLCDPPWYVDAERAVAGPLECGMAPAMLRHVLSVPPLRSVDLEVVNTILADVIPDLPRPAQASQQTVRELSGPLRPVLELNTLRMWGMKPLRGYHPKPYGESLYDFAQPYFVYGDEQGEGESPSPGRIRVTPETRQDFYPQPDGQVVRLRRDSQAEADYLKALGAAGFKPTPKLSAYGGGQPDNMWGLNAEDDWVSFFTATAPTLREHGWVIDVPTGFRHYVLEPESWQAELHETENGWLKLSMDIVVEGQKMPLAPLLNLLFRNDKRWLDPNTLKKIKNTEPVRFELPDGKVVQLRAERIKPLASTLIDLFDSVSPNGDIKLSRLDAARLEALTDAKRWQFSGVNAVLDMAQQLKASQGVKPAPTPPGFGLALRPYQQEGLAWLQFLRQHQLGGILADDMGLGKTAQTLAHLLTEKQAGRLEQPALVVLPTSLIFNWKREAATCAPDLRVLSLHGKARAADFARIAAHDVCLTTYPLLWRDEAELAKHPWRWLILDEAQTVKNAASKAANVVRTLKADHRLCLTGTPLENHLGELWAQFDFLLPGFLGDAKQFTQTWRTPIEKHADATRRSLLAGRIKPFILRRKKEDVAKELPAKTLIVRTVELEGGQRDLYETVRSAMDDKVREIIAAQGFNRSQIVILDALLKLRQVCCDPRLVNLGTAKKVKERAKLDLLMGMLPELVEEGRRILVFSQFTSMLALIEDELKALKLPFVTLTGETKDRESVVQQFQDGKVPVFLISLKAGGVGLNLTRADTVIHYDPWWNPAVENQATDRAHRLGQKNTVFVYKLVVAGSIEERILELQNKKADLAAGVLSEDAKALEKFGEADIRALLAPLPAGA